MMFKEGPGMTILKLDYSKKGKQSKKTKRFLLIAGIIMITLSLLTMGLVVSEGFSLALLIAAAANTLVGLNFILQSREHKLLFPKKYFHISNETIEYKLGGFFRAQRIEWSSISRVSDEGKTVHIYSGDQVIKINMLHFPSSDEKRIKATLKAIAEAKKL